MNKLQKIVYNNGERLIPYVTHDNSELVRHRSSYAFFYHVIHSDLQQKNDEVSIVDLGFGCGYGTAILSSLPNTKVTGVDISQECEIFANQYYYRNNIEYVIEDLAIFIPAMLSYDYVVSRGVLEHVPGGLKLIEKIKFNRRVMIDVPYDELPGNEHHVLTGIKEEAFLPLENIEIFYEDLEGRIYDRDQKPEKVNMIMIVISDPNLPKLSALFDFPLHPADDNKLEAINTDNLSRKRHYYEKPFEILQAVEKAIKETDVVLDIGCGIRPMSYFRPKLHILVEPHQEYVDILNYRNSGDKSVITLNQNALEALIHFASQSVDSIFLLDVIEHINKEEGLKIIQECERVAREQIVIFTPLGFMPQHVHGVDAWGLNGGTFQEHISGWLPADFNADWSLHLCEEYHNHDAEGKQLKKPFGAFFAIKNMNKKHIALPEKLSRLRIPFFSAYDAHRLYEENAAYQQKYLEKEQKCQMLDNQNIALNNTIVSLKKEIEQLNQNYEIAMKNWQVAYHEILNSKSIRFVKFFKKMLSLFKLGHWTRKRIA